MKKYIVCLAMSLMGTSVYADFINKSDKPIVIKLSHVVGANAPKGLASEEFKKIMESKFPGRVKVELYHFNSLFKDSEEVEALELGAVNVIIPTTGKTATSYGVKEFELFDLPFLFSDTNSVLKFMKSDSSTKLLDLLNKKNKTVYAVTYWPNDFRNYIGGQFYKKPDDFKGKVAYTHSLGTMKLFFDTLGTEKTIQLPFSDLPKAMKKELGFAVDVSANPNSNTLQSKLYENTKKLTLSAHDFNAYVFLTNRKWFNNLPADVQNGFVEAAQKSGLYHFEQAQKMSQQDLEKLKALGVQTYQWTNEEREEFKKKAVPVHGNYLKNINADFLNEVYKNLK